MGRLSLNPLKHLDLVGTLSMILFRFGWAKPVPIDSRYFKNHNLGMFFVAIAGIVVNLITAFLAIFIFALLKIDSSITIFIGLLLQKVFIYGIVFAVFNFLPVPPLDGSKIIASFLPFKAQYYLYKYEKYGMIVLIILISTGIINKIMNPIIDWIVFIFVNIVYKMVG